ncbi:MAG: type 2 isopentenyl-diphosphate Delta-isomerase [Candidatus Altiarchaeota archaeon]|nr:type 2 isopentenyl-diphosphate Delta-isomerase [Candidatus Altiarchaeota archaeon]
MNNRKLDHLRICIEKEVESGKTGLEGINLIHAALPEMDFDEIDTEAEFLGKKLRYPILIEGMTGGPSKALKINKDLALIAQEFGIGFGVGSQRMAVEDTKLSDSYKVRDVAPDILLIANLGAVQLNYGYGIKECVKAVEMIDADALALHLNPLQEVVQPEGDKNFSGLIEKINHIAGELKTPVIVKETGCGISYETAKKLNVSAIDVSGHGGTSWSLVESYRARGNPETGKTFAGWGIPTADSLMDVSRLNVPVIASGGIRSGLDAAKSLALGAACVGIALPVLKAWTLDGKTGVREFLNEFIYELKIAMFLTGSKDITGLRGKIRE